MNYNEWAARFPEAAASLENDVIVATDSHLSTTPGDSEAARQQDIRISIASQGAFAWRNNVGATKAKEPCQCPACGFRFTLERQPIRYGLANESAQLNERMKSSDLILAIPRKITPEMVGTTIAQFGSVETKRRGWQFSGKDQEAGQMAWLSLVAKIGGFARFASEPFEL